jgi:hypothetical protein
MIAAAKDAAPHRRLVNAMRMMVRVWRTSCVLAAKIPLPWAADPASDRVRASATVWARPSARSYPLSADDASRYSQPPYRAPSAGSAVRPTPPNDKPRPSGGFAANGQLIYEDTSRHQVGPAFVLCTHAFRRSLRI